MVRSKKENTDLLTDEKLLFIVTVIENYRRTHNLEGSETIFIFEGKNIIEHLSRHYELLITQGIDYTIETIDNYLNTNGEFIKSMPEETLLNTLIKQTVDILSKKFNHKSYSETLLFFYTTNTYKKLQNHDTGLWHESPQFIADSAWKDYGNMLSIKKC